VKKRAAAAAKSATEAEFAVARLALDHRRSLPVRMIDAVGDAGDQPQLRLLSLVAIVTGLVASRRLFRAGFRMLLAHEVATLAKSFVKDRVDRTRPRSARRSADSEAKPGNNRAKEESSFPSGHTAGAVAAAQAFAREFPEYATAARTAAAVVGLAQVPRCAHYPTDVGAGALIGLAAEAGTALLWGRAEEDRRISQDRAAVDMTGR
jgi:membrane-associated phospholipid phosphatase